MLLFIFPVVKKSIIATKDMNKGKVSNLYKINFILICLFLLSFQLYNADVTDECLYDVNVLKDDPYT